MVILPGYLLPLNSEQIPCVSYVPTTTEANDDQFQTEIMVFLREYCDDIETNSTDIQDYLDRSNFDVQITIIPSSRMFLLSFYCTISS